jgi:ZIP family zinc transporter
MAPLSEARTIVLGTIAGSTIFLGLPLGRMRNPAPKLKAFLNAFSAGILLFLLFDILSNATEPLEDAVTAAGSAAGGWRHFSALVVVYVAGFGVGMMALVYEGHLRNRFRRSRGPGAMAVDELQRSAAKDATRVSMVIAGGIGLHNFSEGLAIGQSAHRGEISLALLLVVGFALHNATEGFGIIGPLAGAGVRASWPYLAFAGLVAGAPTFLGTVVGYSFTSQILFVGCLALAAGTITFVIAELLNVGRKMAAWEVTMWGVLAGFLVGLATELVVVAAGA